MNSTSHARSIHPSAQGWRKLEKFAAPVFRPQKAAPFQLVAGAGVQAEFLYECFQSFVLTESDPAKELGWQPPPAARIGVVLAGRGDPDWSLDPEETKF